MYGWSVRDPLPTVLVPLRQEDGVIPLDLAAVFQQTYERGRYGRILRYGEPPALLNESDRAWAADKIAGRRKVSR